MRDDGRIFAWGETNFALSVLPPGLANAEFLAAGALHNLALLATGEARFVRAPANQTVLAGDRTMLHSIAVAGRLTMYQWLKDGVPIPAATNAYYTIGNSQANHGGKYSIVVTSGGSSLTETTVVTIAPRAPVITKAPAGLNLHMGSTAEFSVQAIGKEPISYQWFHRDVALPVLPVSSITASNAVLNAEINSKGVPTVVQFELTHGTASVRNIPASYTYVPLSATVMNLVGGQTYIFRIVASNSVGISYSTNITFTTTREPEVITLQPDPVQATSAKFRGLARPNTLATEAHFEWGTTTNLGSITPRIALGSGTNLVPVEIEMSPLPRNTRVYYELIASNTAGVMHGGPVSFTTSNDVFALPPGEIGITNATLHGLVHPNGFATLANFEWGWTSSLGSATPEVAVNGNTFVTISHSLTGLGSTSDYYFRVVARSPEGVRTSSIVQFRTHHLFTPEPVAGPSLMNIRASDWGDFDNDGRLDLIVLSDMVSRIYRNEGNSQFSITTNNISVAGCVYWGDNNDGHLDLLT